MSACISRMCTYRYFYPFITQNSREATPTRRILPSLKKVSRKQTETVEPLLRNSPPDSSARRPNTQLAASGASELQCPRCLTMYDEKHTDEYLNHWEECARLWTPHISHSHETRCTTETSGRRVKGTNMEREKTDNRPFCSCCLNRVKAKLYDLHVRMGINPQTGTFFNLI